MWRRNPALNACSDVEMSGSTNCPWSPPSCGASSGTPCTLRGQLVVDCCFVLPASALVEWPTRLSSKIGMDCWSGGSLPSWCSWPRASARGEVSCRNPCRSPWGRTRWFHRGSHSCADTSLAISCACTPRWTPELEDVEVDRSAIGRRHIVGPVADCISRKVDPDSSRSLRPIECKVSDLHRPA